jgi:hypothetical protein
VVVGTAKGAGSGIIRIFEQVSFTNNYYKHSMLTKNMNKLGFFSVDPRRLAATSERNSETQFHHKGMRACLRVAHARPEQ